MSKNTNVIENIEKEIVKIDKKENTLFFFVVDTKGVASGSLEYIYNLAMAAKKGGYNVTMLHEETEFVGVGSWLGEDFAALPHANVTKDNVNVSPSDLVFIPEIFAKVMNQIKKLPCKRIAILQNYDYLIEQMPFSAEWRSFGINECITNDAYNENLIKSIFPTTHVTIIPPCISSVFGETNEPKNMVVNIVAADQADVNRIVKPFYWKYPTLRWVSFRDLRGMTKDNFAKSLREAPITIWMDEYTSFGYSAIEAMKSGAIVMAKIMRNEVSWAQEDGTLRNCCVWFDDVNTIHKQIASVVRSVITDKVPDILAKEQKKVVDLFDNDKSEKLFVDYIDGALDNRKKEMVVLESQAKKTEDKKEEK